MHATAELTLNERIVVQQRITYSNYMYLNKCSKTKKMLVKMILNEIKQQKKYMRTESRDKSEITFELCTWSNKNVYELLSLFIKNKEKKQPKKYQKKKHSHTI